MSWDKYEYLKKYKCPCGNGVVELHFERLDDDWNRTEIHYEGAKILCHVCKNKYHVEALTRYYSCPSWIRDGHSTSYYMISNGMKIPKVITKKSDFAYFNNLKEEIINKVTKQDLIDVIADMEKNRYSTRIDLANSKQIVRIFYKQEKHKSLKTILPVLQELLSTYDEYKWNPETIASDRKNEKHMIEENEKHISDVLSKSYELSEDKEIK